MWDIDLRYGAAKHMIRDINWGISIDTVNLQGIPFSTGTFIRNPAQGGPRVGNAPPMIILMHKGNIVTPCIPRRRYLLAANLRIIAEIHIFYISKSDISCEVGYSQ
jgi:hypothetical protein